MTFFKSDRDMINCLAVPRLLGYTSCEAASDRVRMFQSGVSYKFLRKERSVLDKREDRSVVCRDLVDVVMGRRPADLVIRNGRWVNVCSGEIIDRTDIAILGSRIAYCGPNASSMIGENTKVIGAEGRYLVPGLLDAHVHVESSMLTVTQFARGVVPQGTTSAFIDPHEIANVLGLAGVKLMAEETRATPMQIYVQVPSCGPAVPSLETAGARVGPEDVAEAMNYPGVAAGEEVSPRSY